MTLVGNDTGGAICQLVATRHPERLGRLVLTSCDAYEIFPPKPFGYLTWIGRVPGAVLATTNLMRLRALRRLPLAYGRTMNTAPPREVWDSYVRSGYENAAIRRDTKKMLAALSNTHTLVASHDRDMTMFTDLRAVEPELAGRAHDLFASTVNGVLGTIRADGSPRLSGIDPFFFEDELWIGSMAGARKSQDLRRDPRMSLHSIPWESRRVRADATDPGEADVKLTGRAVEVTGADAQRVMDWYWTTQDMDPPGPTDLFHIDLEAVVVISVADDQLVIDRWSAADSRTTVRRS